MHCYYTYAILVVNLMWQNFVLDVIVQCNEFGTTHLGCAYLAAAKCHYVSSQRILAALAVSPPFPEAIQNDFIVHIE